jgi:hypothetical protein
MAGHAAFPTPALLHTELSRLIAAGVELAVRAPPPWAALILGVGVLFLLHGARHRVVLAAPGGAALGLLAARAFVTAMDGPGAAVQSELLWISAGAGALLCAGWPPAFPVLAVALPGAAVGAMADVAGRAWLGAAVGAAAGGLAGALLREWVAALAAGGIGGAAVVAGALGLLAGRPIAAELAEHPMALLAIWAVLAVAGAAFHAGRAWPKGRAPGGEVEPMDEPDRTAWDGRGADR